MFSEINCNCRLRMRLLSFFRFVHFLQFFFSAKLYAKQNASIVHLNKRKDKISILFLKPSVKVKILYAIASRPVSAYN